MPHRVAVKVTWTPSHMMEHSQQGLFQSAQKRRNAKLYKLQLTDQANSQVWMVEDDRGLQNQLRTTKCGGPWNKWNVHVPGTNCSL